MPHCAAGPGGRRAVGLRRGPRMTGAWPSPSALRRAQLRQQLAQTRMLPEKGPAMHKCVCPCPTVLPTWCARSMQPGLSNAPLFRSFFLSEKS
ncbi:hypothetical protein PVAP13_4NG064188, partial [Panicum virgatum]